MYHSSSGRLLTGACSTDNPVSIDNIEELSRNYCITDLRSFWRTLRIPTRAFTSISSASSSFGDLDGDNVDERILNFQQTGMCRIVVLKQSSGNGWTSLAFLDIQTFHLSPEARVVTNDHEHWLAVSHNEVAWGTGLFQQDEVWYALRKGSLVEVLSFPEEGRVEGWGGPLEVSWKADVKTLPFKGSEDRIELNYPMTFRAWNGTGEARNEVTGDFAEKVYFAKHPNSLKFDFDSNASGMSEDEFSSAYDVGQVRWKHFLTVARREIQRTSRNASALQQLLPSLIALCRATAEDVRDCDEPPQSLQR